MSFGVEHFVYACYLLSLHSRWWLNASQACEESGHLLRRSEGLKLIALCNPVWVDVTHNSHSIWSQYLETYNHEVCSLVLTVATVHDWGWRQWTAKAHWPCRQLAMKPTMKSWVHECLLFNLTVTWRDSEQAWCPLPWPHGLFHQRGGGQANSLFVKGYSVHPTWLLQNCRCNCKWLYVARYNKSIRIPFDQFPGVNRPSEKKVAAHIELLKLDW